VEDLESRLEGVDLGSYVAGYSPMDDDEEEEKEPCETKCYFRQ
jgi:hypothetical protein